MVVVTAGTRAAGLGQCSVGMPNVGAKTVCKEQPWYNLYLANVLPELIILVPETFRILRRRLRILSWKLSYKVRRCSLRQCQGLHMVVQVTTSSLELPDISTYLAESEATTQHIKIDRHG